MIKEIFKAIFAIVNNYFWHKDIVLNRYSVAELKNLEWDIWEQYYEVFRDGYEEERFDRLGGRHTKEQIETVLKSDYKKLKEKNEQQAIDFEQEKQKIRDAYDRYYERELDDLREVIAELRRAR